MKSVEHILVVLESLSRADRHWIVERLPDNAKSLLMNQLSCPTTGSNERGADTHYESAASDGASSQVERISPAVAAGALVNEPVWIVAAILQSANATWATQVMQALPASMRPLVMAQQYDSPAIPVPIVTSLRNTLLRNSAMDSNAFIQTTVQPRWRQWLDVIWSRSAA